MHKFVIKSEKSVLIKATRKDAFVWWHVKCNNVDETENSYDFSFKKRS